ncbi:major facilitator superfamily domain-containing protein [Microdochium bolleyi]|uniref:Major facilitator superfamily domain-containing protein n=1 Tax=Microdochium bolleyi TaxID=196109 RepID=A0A136ILC9_9PEZI|nr:major facilitator superfamily domain-containing protein [Microdochium bolleyi]
MTPTDLEAQPVPPDQLAPASSRSSTTLGEEEYEDDLDQAAAALDRTLSRVQTWALEYVDLDFSEQERALERLASTSAAAAAPPATISGLKLHVSPASWSLARKTRALIFPCLAALLAGYAAGAYVFAGNPLKSTWSLSPAAYNTGITAFVLGFGLAPVVLALLSEIYGRYWIFVACGGVFLLGTTGCAVTTSFAGMLVSRFVTGCGASVFATLTAGVVSDLFPRAEDRSTPMAVYSLCLCAGTGVGPLVSGFIAAAAVENEKGGNGGGVLTWRWIFYVQMMLIAGVTLAVALVFEETRANVLLARNCRVLNEYADQLERERGQVWAYEDNEGRQSGGVISESGSRPTTPPSGSCPQEAQEEQNRRQLQQQQRQRLRYRVPHPTASSSSEKPPSLLAQIWRSLCFPLQLLATEPIVSCFSAWVSFAWAILYMQFSTIPRVYRDVYGFDDRQLGVVYVAVIIGCVAGCGMCIAQDKVARSSIVFMKRAGRVYAWLLRWPRRMGDRRQQQTEKSTDKTGVDAGGMDKGASRTTTTKNPESRIYFACLGTLLLPAGLFMFGWTTTTTITTTIPLSMATAAEVSPDFHPVVPSAAIALSVAGIFVIYLAVFNYLADAYGRFASSAQAAQSLCRNVLAGVLPLVADAMFDRLDSDGGSGGGGGYVHGESLLGGIAVLLCFVPYRNAGELTEVDTELKMVRVLTCGPVRFRHRTKSMAQEDETSAPRHRHELADLAYSTLATKTALVTNDPRAPSTKQALPVVVTSDVYRSTSSRGHGEEGAHKQATRRRLPGERAKLYWEHIASVATTTCHVRSTDRKGTGNYTGITASQPAPPC